MRMIRAFRLVLTTIALTVMAACANPQVSTTQAIVDEAKDTVEALKKNPYSPTFSDTLKNARGIVIFPNLYKAGFWVGAEGGNGVMLARDEQGNWGYPAFYTLASGSFGFQIGAQRARSALIIMRQGAIQAIVEHQAKLGADIGLAVAHAGGGLEGSVTTNLGPDIVAFNDAMGLYGGVSLEGGAMVRRDDYNQEYYGTATEPGDIIFKRARTNAAGDALRASLLVP